MASLRRQDADEYATCAAIQAWHFSGNQAPTIDTTVMVAECLLRICSFKELVCFINNRCQCLGSGRTCQDLMNAGGRLVPEGSISKLVSQVRLL